ncbi:MAG: porin [Rubrivivax sp.]
MNLAPTSLALALASVLAAAPALAQTGVTIYGIVDLGLVKPNEGTTPGALLPGRGATPDTWTMKAGNTSRLGFRGQEDLGNGAYARFQIEHRVALDTGIPSNTTTFWLGRSVVAAGTRAAGEVYLGREYSAAYWVALNADPTLWSYVSQTGSAYTYANYTPVPASVEASNIRWSNSVGYKSPTVAGLSFEVARALGENQRHPATSGNLQYNAGPLWIGLGTDRLNRSTHMEVLAAGYDLGVVHPKASYSRAKGGLNGDARAFTVSAMVPTGFGRVFASYGRLEPKAGAESSMIGAGAQLDLSKRTLLYTNLGTARQRGFTRTTVVDAGIKHVF